MLINVILVARECVYLSHGYNILMLKSARKAAKVSLETVSKATGISRQRLARIENAGGKMSFGEFSAIISAINHSCVIFQAKYSQIIHK